jgi:hypothetical protein
VQKNNPGELVDTPNPPETNCDSYERKRDSWLQTNVPLACTNRHLIIEGLGLLFDQVKESRIPHARFLKHVEQMGKDFGERIKHLSEINVIVPIKTGSPTEGRRSEAWMVDLTMNVVKKECPGVACKVRYWDETELKDVPAETKDPFFYIDDAIWTGSNTSGNTLDTKKIKRLVDVEFFVVAAHPHGEQFVNDVFAAEGVTAKVFKQVELENWISEGETEADGFAKFIIKHNLGAVEKQLRHLTELNTMSISSLDHKYPDSYRLKLDVNDDRDPVSGFYEDVFPEYDASFYSNYPLQSGQ